NGAGHSELACWCVFGSPRHRRPAPDRGGGSRMPETIQVSYHCVMALKVHCLAARPDLRASANEIGPLVWPEFMFWDPTGELYFSRLGDYAEFVVVAEDDVAPGLAVARGCSVPFAMGVAEPGRGDLPGDG